MSTLEIGPLEANVNCPMYSYDTPSRLFWRSVIDTLQERGWSEENIKSFLQSKDPRWALDSELGDTIMMVASLYASQVTK